MLSVIASIDEVTCINNKILLSFVAIFFIIYCASVYIFLISNLNSYAIYLQFTIGGLMNIICKACLAISFLLLFLLWGRFEYKASMALKNCKNLIDSAENGEDNYLDKKILFSSLRKKHYAVFGIYIFSVLSLASAVSIISPKIAVMGPLNPIIFQCCFVFLFSIMVFFLYYKYQKQQHSYELINQLDCRNKSEGFAAQLEKAKNYIGNMISLYSSEEDLMTEGQSIFDWWKNQESKLSFDDCHRFKKQFSSQQYCNLCEFLTELVDCCAAKLHHNLCVTNPSFNIKDIESRVKSCVFMYQTVFKILHQLLDKNIIDHKSNILALIEQSKIKEDEFNIQSETEENRSIEQSNITEDEFNIQSETEENRSCIIKFINCIGLGCVNKARN